LFFWIQAATCRAQEYGRRKEPAM
jgi:hypothetical protein